MTDRQFVPLDNDEDQCDGCLMICLRSQADFASHDGDRLCRECRAVFWTAQILLDRGVIEEEVIIPTLVFARNAAGSQKYMDLTNLESPVDGPSARLLAEIALDAMGIVFLHDAQAYMGLELVEVADGVPLVRVRPYTMFAENYPATNILERVHIQILSRYVKPASIRDDYERFLEERGAHWGENLTSGLSCDFSRSYLEVVAESDAGFRPPRPEDGDNPLCLPVYHFPAPTVVEGLCWGVLRSLREGDLKGNVPGLDLYGKTLNKTAERIIPAFVAWHVGASEWEGPSLPGIKLGWHPYWTSTCWAPVVRN